MLFCPSTKAGEGEMLSNVYGAQRRVQLMLFLIKEKLCDYVTTLDFKNSRVTRTKPPFPQHIRKINITSIYL